MKRCVPQKPVKVLALFDFQSTVRYIKQKKEKKKRLRKRLYLYTKEMLGEALDPGTSPERLQVLARVRGLAARVAVNPNTPASLLRILCASYPNEVLENPSLPLLFLEDPGFLHGLKPGLTLALLSQPSCPLEYLETCVAHPDVLVRVFLAESPRSTAYMLQRLSEESQLAASVARNPNASPALLVALAESDNHSAREDAILNPAMPRERARLLRHASGTANLGAVSSEIFGVDPIDLRSLAAGGVYACWLAARHPDTPLDCLESLSRHQDEQTQIFLASNPSLTPALADLFARSPERTVRTQIASHPALSVDSMRLLSRDDCLSVRERLAENKRLPVFLLGGLARDEELSVLAAVTRNGRVTPEILTSLAIDPALRLLLCSHPRLPTKVLESFLADADAEVRREARARLKVRGQRQRR